MNTGQHSFEAELEAQRQIYDALKPFAMQDRDRLLRMVQERMARERAPDRLHSLALVRGDAYARPESCRAGVEHIDLDATPLPPDAA